MRLKHFLVPESKKVLKKKKSLCGIMSEKYRSQLKELLIDTSGTIGPQNKVILDFNLKHKININEYILIQVNDRTKTINKEGRIDKSLMKKDFKY